MNSRYSILDLLRIPLYILAIPFYPIMLFVFDLAVLIRKRLTKRGKLFRAIWEGRNYQIQALVGKGLDVNKRDTGLHYKLSGRNFPQTPLMCAAEKGEREMVQTLLNAGADVNADTLLEDSPLMYAAKNGHTEVVKVLLQAGADVAGEDGSIPLELAAEGGFSETARKLMEYGAKY